MNFYLVTRNDHCDWDEYDGLVVRAASHQEAKRLALVQHDDWDEPRYPGFTEENVQSKLVGVDGPSGVILASFRAG
jgi:hypothetical protein